MKSKCFRLWPVLAAGLMISPLCAQAPARPAASPPGDAPREAPNPDRLKAAVGRIAELRKAGKQDEANQLAQRLREAAKDNPRVARQISEAMKARHQPRTDAARPDRGRPETPNRQDARKDAPTPQHRPMMRQQGPQAAPQRPMMRQQGPQAAPQCPMMRPQGPQACPLAAQAKPQRPMMGKAAPEVRAQVGKIRHLAQASLHLAAAGYPDQAGKARAEAASLGTALKAKMTKAEAAKPKEGAPKAAAPKEKTAKKHDVKQHEAKQPEVKKHEAKKPEVKKHEAKQPEAKKPEAKQPEAKKHEVKKHEAKKHDTNALVLGQLKSVSKQLNDLSNRVSKLEKAKHSDKD